MSKPKPGLGKVVRTLVHPASSSGYSSIQLSSTVNTVVNHAANSASVVNHHHGHTSYAAATAGSGAASGRRDFSTLGLPPSVGTASSASAVSAGGRSGHGVQGGSGGGSGLFHWEGGEKDIVKPFRPVSNRGGYRPSSPASSPHPSCSTSTSSKRPLSTLPPPPASMAFPADGPSGFLSGFSSLPNLSSLSLPLWTAFTDKAAPWSTGHHHTHPTVSYDIIAIPPSPPPTIRSSRPNELHSALSPTSATLSDSTTLASTAGTNGFASLGLPSHAYSAIPSSDPETPSVGLSTRQLIFHLGASGLAKERPPFKPNPRRQSSPTPPPRPRSFPLPEVDPPSCSELRSVGVGEDAYFARLDGMCIADGVGGWARSGRGGADAGRWSRLLTHFCEVELESWGEGKGHYALDMDAATTSTGKGLATEGWSKKVWEAGGMKFSTGNARGKRKHVDPVEIMQRGYEKCLSCFMAEGIHGSSTCLLALLHNSTLSVANLGDCCLLLIRSNEIIFRTDEMQHAFNFPLQLGTHSRDEPMKDAKRYDVGVGRGDVVVLGSDGLMDNLFDEDILETLAQFAPPSHASTADSQPTASSEHDSLPPFSPQKVSEELCRRARAVSEQVSATTPFMVRAIEEGIDFVGGKKDDISVVVGVIGDREGSEQNDLALHTH